MDTVAWWLTHERVAVVVEVDVTEICVAVVVAVDVFVVTAVFGSRGTGTDQSLALGTHYIAACVTVVKAISVAGVCKMIVGRC